MRFVDFPVLTVPRTDKTEIFYPMKCGQVRRPKWKNAKPGAKVAMADASGMHFMAALNGTNDSWYVDQRGDARLRPNWAIARKSKDPKAVTLIFRHAPQLTEANRAAGVLPFGGTIRTFRGDWFAAAEIYRRWAWEQPWEELYPDQYALEFARGVAMGMQPMVHQLRMSHFDDPRYAGNFKFTVDTAKFYYANRDFLYDGTMCAPGRLVCARQPVELFCRGIYTKPKNVRVVRHPAHPAILHSVWRAKDGRVAAVLVNWTRKEQAYDLATPDIAAAGVLPARSWRIVVK